MISIVILAAGRSTRLGEPKQLLPLGGKPLLAHTIANALATAPGEVIVVLGHRAESIRAVVERPDIRFVINPKFAEGQSTSVIAGLEAVHPASDGVMFLLGDQPEVGYETIVKLIDAFKETSEPIVAPLYGGVMGNPVLFRRELFPELLGVSGDEGARAVIRKDPTRVFRLTLRDGPPPADVDTREDYEALVGRWEQTSQSS